MRKLDCEIVINNDFVDIHFHCAIQSSSLLLLHCSLGLARVTCVAFFFYEFCYVCIKATPSVSPPPPQIALGICLVHVLKYCSYYVSEHEACSDKIFKRFVNLRMDYQKLQHQRDPSQPLTACQQWKLTDLSYLKTFYKQGHKTSRRGTSRTSTEHSSDEEADDRGHESS